MYYVKWVKNTSWVILHTHTRAQGIFTSGPDGRAGLLPAECFQWSARYKSCHMKWLWSDFWENNSQFLKSQIKVISFWRIRQHSKAECCEGTCPANKSLKVSSTVIAYGKFSSELTSENLFSYDLWNDCRADFWEVFFFDIPYENWIYLILSWRLRNFARRIWWYVTAAFCGSLWPA